MLPDTTLDDSSPTAESEVEQTGTAAILTAATFNNPLIAAAAAETPLNATLDDSSATASVDNNAHTTESATATPTTPKRSPAPSPTPSPAPSASPLTQAIAADPPPTRASHFFTPSKTVTPSVAGSPSTASSSLLNGHSTPSFAASAALPSTAVASSAVTSTPVTSRDKPPLHGSSTATPGTRGKAGSLTFDPLLHPVDQPKGTEQDEDGSGGSATPSHSPAAPLAPLITSASASDLRLAGTSSPASSPSHAVPAAAPLTASASYSVPAAATATPTSSSSSTSIFSSSTPITSSSSSGGLSSWFSSFSSSSFSRDVALISSPPALFDNYYNEATALLHTLQQHPPPNAPDSLDELRDKLSHHAASSSAVATAVSDHDGRRKHAAAYQSSNTKKRLAKLQKMLQLNDGYVMDMKHLILKARRKCDAGHDALLAIVERLRACFWMGEFNLLQEGMHLQDELFDNYEDMCKAAIRQVKERTKELQQLVEQLNSSSAAAASQPPPSEFLFLSPRQVALLCPLLPDMLQRQSDLAARLAQVKVEYVAVARVTEEEEKVSRHERIVRAVDDFFANYNGDLTADYSPARSIEYEFTKCLLDERCKEGQTLNKWMASIQQQARAQLKESVGGGKGGGGGKEKEKDGKERVTHSSILHFVRKFESNFIRDYGLAAARRLFLRLLIQRMLFPRIWDVCVLVEECDSDTREQDERFVAQAEWLRCLGLEQLGVPAAFLMPEQVKLAASSRWIKSGGGAQQADGDDEGVGGGVMPRELPTALRSLLHGEEEEKKASEEDSVSQAGQQRESVSLSAVVGAGEDEDDEFGRQFTKGRKKKTLSAGDNLFAKFDDDSKAAAEDSPSFSPSPSVASPLSKSVSSASLLSTSVPLSSTPPVASMSAPATSSVPPLPKSDSTSALATTSTPARSSHATTKSSSSSPPASSSSSTPSAPIAARIADLKARHPPLPNRLRPYLACIDCLEDITHLTCPLDMLQCLLAVARNIYKTATEYAQLNSPPLPAGAAPRKAELGADSFFPILLYVLIQADVKDLHRRLRFMKEYGLVKTDDLAEHKYYATCVEGGVNYVMNAQPEEY